MAHTQNQLPLSLPKPRVILQEDDEELLPIRLPKKVAQAVVADPEGAKQFLSKEAQTILDNRLALLGDGFKTGEPDIYTKWSLEKPGLGIWNVTDSKTGTLNALWWFGGVWWTKGIPGNGSLTSPGFTHDQFVKQYAWRGLKECPQEAYQCPPYAPAWVAENLPGAAIDGKYIKRTRAPLEE